MVKRFINNHWSLKGFTLVELMIVIGIIGILSVIVFSANRTFTRGQAVSKAQRDFLANLRSLKTGVDSGANGDPYKVLRIMPGGTMYQIWSDYTNPPPDFREETVRLPPDVRIVQDNMFICIANPNFTKSWGGVYPCGGCTGSTFFACRGGPQGGLVTIQFDHSAGTNYRQEVVIQGHGMKIDRMYAN